MRILHAYRINAVQVAAWCQICGVYHYHGDVDGSRVPHCHDKDGIKTSNEDYYIRVVGDAPKWMHEDIKKGK